MTARVIGLRLQQIKVFPLAPIMLGRMILKTWYGSFGTCGKFIGALSGKVLGEVLRLVQLASIL